jgi:hypothetical protein
MHAWYHHGCEHHHVGAWYHHVGAWYHHGWLVPSWVAGLEDKKRVAQKWSNSLSELLRRLMSYLLADGSN